MTPRRNHQSTV